MRPGLRSAGALPLCANRLLGEHKVKRGPGGAMLVATFNSFSGRRAGKTIHREDDAFRIAGQGLISADDLMIYDAAGCLDWPSPEMRCWAMSFLPPHRRAARRPKGESPDMTLGRLPAWLTSYTPD